MSDNNNFYSFITYVLLFILIVIIFSLSFKYKFKRAQRLSFRSLTNKNSNAPVKENYTNLKEGFREGLNESNYSKKESDNIFKMIDNKLKGLIHELGGPEGKTETKKILVNTISAGVIDTNGFRKNLVQISKIRKQKLNKILQFEKNKIPLKKFGKPDDILRLIKFLIYENKWMTGSNIIIDGGKIETVN
jgi:hypothetical protein